MQYFSNLPKISFESTIGTFNISDFFTYIDISNANITPYEREYDNKNTLIEAASLIYGSADSFWLFIFSSNNYNPFALNPENTDLKIQKETNKLNISLKQNVSGTTGFVAPKGSIIVQYQQNTGGSAAYSSIDNYDLDGAFTLVENDYYYSETVITKNQKNGSLFTSGITGNSYVIIYPSSTGGYQIKPLLYSTTVEPALDKQLYSFDADTGKIVYETKTYNVAVSEGLYDEGAISQVLYSTSSNSENVTYETFLKKQNRTIFAYPLNKLGELRSYFVTAKYY
jgi:hypothetical protein